MMYDFQLGKIKAGYYYHFMLIMRCLAGRIQMPEDRAIYTRILFVGIH